MAAHAQGSAVVSPQFCMPQPLTLMMQEYGYGTNRDDFVISDEQGRHWFTLKAAHISMSNSRQLLDASGRPLVVMSAKLISLHKSWVMSRPDGSKLAEIKPSLLAAISPSIKVYLQDGDKEADYVVKGDFRGKRFSITQVLPGADRVVAEVKKESKFSSATAFLRSKLTDQQRYFIEIQPGADAAFIAALATLCDEIFNDGKEAPRQAAY